MNDVQLNVVYATKSSYYSESLTELIVLHCKNIRISTVILWRVFHILTEPVWALASLFSRFTDTNVHGTGSVKIWKTRHKISLYIRILFAVYRSPIDVQSHAISSSTLHYQHATRTFLTT